MPIGKETKSNPKITDNNAEKEFQELEVFYFDFAICPNVILYFLQQILDLSEYL